MSNLFAKREKKELTPTQKKVKEVLGWVVSVICVIIILAALAISVLTITRTTSDTNVAHIGKSTFNSVVTDSMEPTIKKGELIIAKLYNDETDRANLKVGQTIVYKDLVYNAAAGGNITIIEVHRIDALNSNTCHVVGDNPVTGAKGDTVNYTDIVATWGTPASQNEDGTFNVTEDTEGKSLGQLGTFVNWLQEDRTNYFCVIVLPLILLFVIYGFILIRSLILAKLNKENSNKVSVDELSEEEKKRLAEELLASLNKPEQVGGEAEIVETDSSENPEIEENNSEIAEPAVEEENTEILETEGEEGGQE